MNGTSCNQILYETHIVSPIRPFSLPYKRPWMTLKGQIKVIDVLAGFSRLFFINEACMTKVY